MAKYAIPTAIVMTRNVQRMVLVVFQEMALGILREIAVLVSFATQMEFVLIYALKMQLVVRQEMAPETYKETVQVVNFATLMARAQINVQKIHLVVGQEMELDIHKEIA